MKRIVSLFLNIKNIEICQILKSISQKNKEHVTEVSKLRAVQVQKKKTTLEIREKEFI